MEDVTVSYMWAGRYSMTQPRQLVVRRRAGSRAGMSSSAPTRRPRRWPGPTRGEDGETAQEASVRLVLPRDRTLALPAAAAQQVEAAVVADAGVRVDGDVVGARVALRPARPGRPTRPARPGGGVRRRRVRRRRRARRAAGSSGRWVGGGPAIRSWWVMELIVHGKVLTVDVTQPQTTRPPRRGPRRRTRGPHSSRCASASS